MKTFNLEEFIAFCESKGDTWYDATNASICALGQYGLRGVVSDDLLGVPSEVYGRIINMNPDTFSALALRLKELRDA